MSIRKTAAILSIVAIALAACNGGGASTAPSAGAPTTAASGAASPAGSTAAGACKVGVAWATFQE